MNLEEEFSSLHTLLGGYFFQTWEYMYGSPEGVVKEFIKESPKECVEGALYELDCLLSMFPDEQELSDAVLDLGCEYYPGDDVPYSQWLQELKTMLLCNE